MKGFFGMIMSIIDPRWTTDSLWCLCEQLYILNLIGVNRVLITRNLPWKVNVEEVLGSVFDFDDAGFVIGTVTWLHKSYDNDIS